jgi:mannose-6-phosphate isomerase-like protein (cupin superfamily)
MERRAFIKAPLAATGALLAADARLDFPSGSAQSPGQPVIVKADADRDAAPFKFLDGLFYVKVSGKDTEGRCVIFDTLRPEKVGPALHFHTDCDEWFFVREGEFKFQVGEDVMRLKAGDSLLAPRGVKHAFVKTSEGVARLIVMHQPAGTMEEYFRTGAASPNITAAERQALGEKHGMKFVGGPLKPD